MITICMTYFRSLTLSNLRAALFSVRRQELTRVREIILVDNNTEDETPSIAACVDEQEFPVPVRLVSLKHGNFLLTHSWSTNQAVQRVQTPLILFTRADYILYAGLLAKFFKVFDSKPAGWDGFVTGNVCHLSADITMCEDTEWRHFGPRVLERFPHAIEDYTMIDSGVWMASKKSFDKVGGLDETLSAWGHAQTDFQHRLHLHGTEFVRIPETLFYHPMHSGERDINLAHAQLSRKGVDIRQLWKRHEGRKPYGEVS